MRAAGWLLPLGCPLVPAGLKAPSDPLVLARRHHFFEGRPLQLFLLHAVYHAIVLTGCCCLLGVFGHPHHTVSGGSGGGRHDGIAGMLPEEL